MCRASPRPDSQADGLARAAHWRPPGKAQRTDRWLCISFQRVSGSGLTWVSLVSPHRFVSGDGPQLGCLNVDRGWMGRRSLKGRLIGEHR
jgi:hypothetical protein